MNFKNIIQGLSCQSLVNPAEDLDVQAISCDSRDIVPNSIFVALKGEDQDGARFIEQAIQKGAKIIVTDAEPRTDSIKDICWITTPSPKTFLVGLLQNFYPDIDRVQSIGITGTNGKTTVSYLLESIFKTANQPCGVLGTVNHRIRDKQLPSHNTTPAIVDVYRFLNRLVEENIFNCVMEVSSHGLKQGRVAGLHFKIAIFTGLTSEHLDYHETMADYFASKALLFTHFLDNGTAVINVDDEYGQQLCLQVKSPQTTYGIDHEADIQAKDIQMTLNGSQFLLVSGDDQIQIKTSLIGRHNIYNIMAAAGAALSQGFNLGQIKQGVEALSSVPGRLQKIESDEDYSVFIDYAHTDDALKNVLESFKDITHQRIILVFGCGGDRDKSKRSRMGAVAEEYADFSIITSDNPRSEDPHSIIQDIQQGFTSDHYKTIVDRKEAIHYALDFASPTDIVLIAGKGHEDYQILGDQKILFNEQKIIKDYYAHSRRNSFSR